MCVCMHVHVRACVRMRVCVCVRACAPGLGKRRSCWAHTRRCCAACRAPAPVRRNHQRGVALGAAVCGSKHKVDLQGGPRGVRAGLPRVWPEAAAAAAGEAQVPWAAHGLRHSWRPPRLPRVPRSHPRPRQSCRTRAPHRWPRSRCTAPPVVAGGACAPVRAARSLHARTRTPACLGPTQRAACHLALLCGSVQAHRGARGLGRARAPKEVGVEVGVVRAVAVRPLPARQHAACGAGQGAAAGGRAQRGGRAWASGPRHASPALLAWPAPHLSYLPVIRLLGLLLPLAHHLLHAAAGPGWRCSGQERGTAGGAALLVVVVALLESAN